MEINLMELWSEMGAPVRLVVIVLTLQAIGCIAVAIDRLIVLRQSGKRAQQFAALAQPDMQAGNFDQVARVAGEVQSNHLSALIDVGIRSFLTRRHAGDDALRAADLTRRAMERKGDAISRDLNRGMNVIASTGSTAPFVGLLGTVLGIINAFKLIAADGSGGIGTIGAAIGEALVVTGYGLMVAIPAVLLFNMLSSMIAKYEAGLLNAGSELVDQLETTVTGVQAARVSNSGFAPSAQANQPAVVRESAPAPRYASAASPAAAHAPVPVQHRAAPPPRPAPLPQVNQPAPDAAAPTRRRSWSAS